MLSALAGMTLVSGAALAGIDWDSTSAFQAIAQPAAATQPADAAAQTTTPATEPAKLGSSQPKATYLLSPDKFTSDEKVGWDGFLTGLRGFEHFYAPIGDPIYFESPFNNTEVRLLYVWHDFADGCQLNGGTLNILAAQVRVALTERLGFIATKDGYSFLNAGALPDGDGWNDLAAGLKYVAYASKEDDFVLTPGVRFQFQTGESDVLQNSCFEVSPFISFARSVASLASFASLRRCACRSCSTIFLFDSVAGTAIFRGSRKLRAYPGATFTTCPRVPRLSISSRRMTSMVLCSSSN